MRLSVKIEETPAEISHQPELAFCRVIQIDTPIGLALVVQYLSENGAIAKEFTEWMRNRWQSDMRMAMGEEILPCRRLRKAVKMAMRAIMGSGRLGRPNLVRCGDPACGWTRRDGPTPEYCETCDCHGVVSSDPEVIMERPIRVMRHAFRCGSA
jgi:hypothetical protein